MPTLTQLSSCLFPLTYPLFFFSPGLAPHPLPQWITSPGGALCLLNTFFSSCPLIPSLRILPLHPVCKWHHGATVVEHHGTPPVHPSYAPSNTHTTRGFPLQYPATPCNTPRLRLVALQLLHRLTYLSGLVQTVPCIHPLRHTHKY